MEVALELTGLLGPASALTDPLGCGGTGLTAGLSYGSRQVSLASNGRGKWSTQKPHAQSRTIVKRSALFTKAVVLCTRSGVTTMPRYGH